ncbi:MAG TPA: MBL fold metallo-hydrolase [Gemmatimonadales bacterium]|jgi:hydroxyacylglutathione hydrolase
MAMFFKRFFDEKLAQVSYLVGCQVTDEALVVDPNRNLDPYVEAASAEKLRIAQVTETHIHADFVSGARELAQRTGARLLLSAEGGSEWQYQYADEPGIELLHDGSCFQVGKVRVDVLHLPGHTPEHLGFLVTDTAAATEPMGAFTGDFLFVGDVGRPDLLERAAGQAGTMEVGARRLFRSLQRFRQLSDYLQIWPGHGAGSACGKMLGAVPQSTLGYEKRFNWAFSIEDEAEFVRAVLAGQPDPPRYFAQMKRINQSGPRMLGTLRRPPRLPVGKLAELLASGTLVVDTRPAGEYAAGAIPGTLNIPLGRSFTTWAGWLIPYDRDFVLIVDDHRTHRVEEAVRDLAGIGLDRVIAYCGAEVVEAWRTARGQLQTIESIPSQDVAEAVASNRAAFLDVRSLEEWSAGHLPGARNLPLGELDERLNEVPRDQPVIVHCQSGARAAIAASLLFSRGISNVQQYPGGFGDWVAAGRPVEKGEVRGKR